MSLQQILTRAAPLALALSVAAPQAWAISPLSESKCLEPSAAAEDVADFYQGLDTRDFDGKQCRRLCKGLARLCKGNARMRLKCVKNDDKFFYRLEARLCGDDAGCREELKEEARACRADLKQEARDSREGCVDLAVTCAETCAGGGLFD